MLEALIDEIMKRYPFYGFFLVVLILLGILITYVVKFVVETKHICKDMPGIKLSLVSIEKSMNSLNLVLLEKDVISQSVYSVENSPRVMNDDGKELYASSGGKNIIDRLGTSFNKELELKKDQLHSALEVERESLILMLSKANNSEFKEIQKFAYNHPTHKGKKVAYTDLLFLMSLNLRDLYLENHPEIK